MRTIRFLLVLCIVALIAIAAIRDVRASTQRSTIPAFKTAEAESGGTFPVDWIDGTDCENEPQYQVHPYNDDFYIIRQSKCVHFEAPFMFLLFGTEKALLLDTGSHTTAPIFNTVKGVVDQWMKDNGKTVPLIVAHTHSHGDHIMGDGQFRGQPGVEQVIGTDLQSVIDFWGFKDFPNDKVTLDLGGRVLDVLGTPGHNATSISVYDRQTQLMLTGDLVYPGHIFIFSPANWREFLGSLRRLVDFCTENPVQWLVGCHIEYTTTPGQPYAWGTPQQPDETVLQLNPSILRSMLRAAWSMEDNPECRIYDDFVIHIVYECGIGWNGDA